MKIEDVPQDGQILGKDGISVRDVCYAQDESGNYTQVFSVGWQPKNEALMQAWDLVLEEAEEARQAALSGKESPLRYHMMKCLLDVPMLSSYTGQSKKQIRKHFQSEAFLKLSPDILEIYAKAMKITVAGLCSV